MVPPAILADFACVALVVAGTSEFGFAVGGSCPSASPQRHSTLMPKRRATTVRERRRGQTSGKQNRETHGKRSFKTNRPRE
jgi:hypothetical protein